MLRVLCVLRCALSVSHTHLESTWGNSDASFPPRDIPSSSKGSIGSSAEVERAAAVESLSNEVFGRGNKHLKNVETLTALPEGLHSFPEVCFIGKPNCGKSSLVSCLLHNARLGKAGATGGTTRLLQFFNVGDALLLVDTPGYGGWKGRQLAQSLAERANAFSILFRYLALRKKSNLKRVYWLMEASARSPVSFQARDEELLAFLSRERIPFSVVLTKIDRHWRLYADQQRKTAVVGKDGFPHPGHVEPEGGPSNHIPVPDEGVARNMREVFEFLGTDTVPILGVSSNRKKPDRSRNLDLLQHDIVHYCTRDLLPGEPLTFANLHKLSYAPPAAAHIQEIQLRYPVESFVVPQNNNLSLLRMVEQHEEMKARFRTNNVSAARLTAKDVAACHLGSTAEAADAVEQEGIQRSRLGDVIPSTTFLFEAASQPPGLGETDAARHLKLAGGSVDSAHEIGAKETVSLWRESDVMSATTERHPKATPATATRSKLRTRPSLAARPSSSSAPKADWDDALTSLWESEDAHHEPSKGEEWREQSSQLLTKRNSTHALCDDSVSSAGPSEAAVFFAEPTEEIEHNGGTILMQERTPPPLSLPAMIDSNVHYVTAIDGTKIPRSMISVSVEQLAVNKEDEMTHFATKSGAGAYEELMLLDHESDAATAADPFTEVEDFARLPEAVQSRLLDAKQHRTRSAARKQEERFLSKYVEKKRKERSIYMHAEGYMCPWVGVPETRDVVRGLSRDRSFGAGGAVLRGLKQKGFGGKSYSARTMKNTGRATKKTGSWAA